MPDLSRPSPTIACVIFQKNDTHYLNVMEDGIYIDTSDFTLEVRLSNKYAKPSLSILEYFMAPDDDEDEPPSTPASLERTTVSLLENLLDQRSDMLTFLEFKVKVLAGLSALEDTAVEKDQKIAALEKQLQEKKEADDAHIIKRLDSLEHKMDLLLSSKDDDAEGECAPDYPKGRVPPDYNKILHGEKYQEFKRWEKRELARFERENPGKSISPRGIIYNVADGVPP